MAASDKIKVRVTTKFRPASSELLAVGYIDDADRYADAAKQLTDFKHFNPRYFLYCHAIELALKAYILASGGDDREVRKIKHDLGKAYRRASELGYTPALDGTAEIVDWLHPYHQDYAFRYKQTGIRAVPRPEDIDEVINSMLLEIEKTARAAFKRRA